jgi:hypothetical protein
VVLSASAYCQKTLSADSLLRFASVDSFAPAQLALRAAFGSLSRPFPKVSILVNHENPGHPVTFPSLCPLNTKKENKSGLTPPEIPKKYRRSPLSPEE